MSEPIPISTTNYRRVALPPIIVSRSTPEATMGSFGLIISNRPLVVTWKRPKGDTSFITVIRNLNVIRSFLLLAIFLFYFFLFLFLFRAEPPETSSLISLRSLFRTDNLGSSKLYRYQYRVNKQRRSRDENRKEDVSRDQLFTHVNCFARAPRTTTTVLGEERRQDEGGTILIAHRGSVISFSARK